VLFLVCCLGLVSYTLILRGCGSNSKYRLLGRLRSVAQTLRYEVGLVVLLLTVVLTNHSLSFSRMQGWTGVILAPLGVLWVRTVLAETNRAPFDLAEGERELVRGFNTEFSAAMFVCLFIAEYGSLLFFSVLTTLFLFQSC